MSQRMYTIEGLVDELIGPVGPCGEHQVDTGRLDNLKMLCQLHEYISETLCGVANTAHAGRSSMKLMSDYARKHVAEEVEGVADVVGIELKTEETI